MEEKSYLTAEDLESEAKEEFINLVNQGRLKDLLKKIGLMSNYTVFNNVLMMKQMPSVTFAKRLTDWNKDGRWVKENQKSLKIIVMSLKKYNHEAVDENGLVVAKGVDKMDKSVGHVFDISQTEGKDYLFLHTNKETVAKFFEATKKSLERTARSYEFEYVSQGDNVIIDKDAKKVFIKDGLTIDTLLNTLVETVTKILLDTRYEEDGCITKNEVNDIDKIEYECTVYAIKNKLGLDVQEFDTSSIENLANDIKLKFVKNLQKVRSVCSQMLSNVETSIEIALRGIDKTIEQVENSEKEIESQSTVVNSNTQHKKLKSVESEAE